jgi:hypothetical protein
MLPLAPWLICWSGQQQAGFAVSGNLSSGAVAQANWVKSSAAKMESTVSLKHASSWVLLPLWVSPNQGEVPNCKNGVGFVVSSLFPAFFYLLFREIICITMLIIASDPDPPAAEPSVLVLGDPLAAVEQGAPPASDKVCSIAQYAHVSGHLQHILKIYAQQSH